ncbi:MULTISPECIES: hypothetical protein [Acinetobacter calcoaceticus/baumannii complex]|uniref:hypothetical protein n=1 Tax=Acinetobacter calcoaceticus/baumannii complex TaxID=909768 RepID=UPI0001FFC424|nr:hypothetical protein [Acinetobacter baumannii]ADX93457.1 hypothetical protein ABTW07_3034 [Acinetobacter baumannii TCDC-AB0715]MBP4453460.1 hypothetical protein [Acinetobacter baumannii]MBP4542034.1 hypothetical protein [Acinetobacter baumannii]MCF4653661.1 hypothetical protein [Acinetobacter baumannii]MDW5390367.1 hypothetical protein [Acinetobacter baumannii]
MNDHIPLISKLIFALSIFAFVGWYFAEQDNEILRQELISLKYNMSGDHYDITK